MPASRRLGSHSRDPRDLNPASRTRPERETEKERDARRPRLILLVGLFCSSASFLSCRVSAASFVENRDRDRGRALCRVRHRSFSRSCRAIRARGATLRKVRHAGCVMGTIDVDGKI